MGSCVIKSQPLRVDSSSQTDLVVPAPTSSDDGLMIQAQPEDMCVAYAYRKVLSKSGVTRCLPYDASPMDVFDAVHDYKNVET